MTEKSLVFHIFRIFLIFRVFRVFRIFRAFRGRKPIPWLLVAGAALLVLLLWQWIDWGALIVLLILGALVLGGIISQVVLAGKAPRAPYSASQPTEHPAASANPEPAPYTQGYQARPWSANAPSGSAFAPTNAEPPMMAQYPEPQERNAYQG